MKREITKILGIATLGFLLGLTPLQAQEVWPGDVNNNGIVNNIDILYWALAKDSVGPARPVISGDWSAQPISEFWSQDFPDGLNFAFADCDGDGAITDDDLTIIKNNYHQVHGIVSPDEYFLGNAGEDPVLLLNATDPLTEPGAEEEVTLSLGVEGDSIYNFFGIAFTVHFDTDNIKDSPGSSNQNFSFEFTPDSWIDGQGTQMAKEYLYVDDDNGIAEMAIYRKSAGDPIPSGAGAVGKFTIVMEDIIVGLVQLGTDSIRLIDNQLESTKIAPSNTSLAEDSLLLDSREYEVGSDEVMVYPNPATDWLTIELRPATGAKARNVEMYTLSGQLMGSWKASRPAAKAKIKLSALPQGLYLLKIETDKGIFMRKVARVP
ncbi:MAG: T9SS type A sorting domain-containing protein [Phaeodactylibacter sp.]|nr:T9SS type A sorting domain-containing protein [Phaeodactylibacter sp.]MCB9275195.1 T9SS type A sorting domain-containing protein [Lewinellaceae bacterium]